MVGTGLLAKLDIRVKCIHRCSAALPEATDVASSFLIMLDVLIGFPIHSGAQEGHDRQEPAVAPDESHRQQWQVAYGGSANRDHNHVACCTPLTSKSCGY
jgi:hypothetical protein